MNNHLHNLKQYLLAAGLLLAGFTVALAQNKGKKTDKLDEDEQLIIKWKGDAEAKAKKNIKLVIEIKDDQVLVNGKPVEDFNNEDLAVLKKNIMIFDGDHFNRRMAPPVPGSPFRTEDWSFDENRPGFDMLLADPNKPFLGVGSDKADKGVVIKEVTDGSAAEKAGLKQGDLITKIDNTPINTPEELSKTIGRYKPEDKIMITFSRDGKEQQVGATLGRREGPMGMQFRRLDELGREPFIMNFEDGQPKLGIRAQDTEDGKGVKVLDIDEESAAEKAGLKEGDVITAVDGREVDNVNQLLDAVRSAKDAKKLTIPFKYQRDNTTQQTEVKIPRKLKTAEL